MTATINAFESTNVYKASPTAGKALAIVAVLTVFIGCSSTIPSLRNPAPVIDIDDTEQHAMQSHWQSDIPINTLNEALAAGNPFVNTGQKLPHELAISILNFSNLEQSWESFDATHQSAHPESMSANQFGRYSIAFLQGLEQQNRHKEIADWLNSRTYLRQFPLVSSAQQVTLSLINANQLEHTQQFLESARERIFIHDFIADDSQQTKNHQQIWQNLLAVNEKKLTKALNRGRYRELHSWIELAVIVQNFQLPSRLQHQAIADWKRSWPRHPAYAFAPRDDATNTLSSTVFGGTAFGRPSAQQLAIFLPLSGKLASAGRAVRDGILTAHFDSQARSTKDGHNNKSLEQQTNLTFYDTREESIEALYARAVNEGASTIIGPLQKHHVRTLFTTSTDLPIITLNYVGKDFPPTENIVQFGLAAEDEASQLALRAQRKGFKQPILFVSQKDWARRAAQAFSQQWQEIGGGTPEIQTISQRSAFSNEITNGLKLPQSIQRHTSLQNATAQQLSFTPRRRQDIDVIILFVNDQDARAINPLLAYHYAADLPVMASSYVHGGQKIADYTDLNGIIFSELPWLLPEYSGIDPINNQERELLKSKTQKRLYAMGQDAFHLSSRIGQLTASPNAQWSANTGRISIRDSRVVREAPLAQFQQGQVVLID